MEIKDKVMYHYHRLSIHDDSWKSGNILTVDSSFDSHFSSILKKFGTDVITADQSRQSFDRIIKYYIEEMNPDREMLIKLLTAAREIIRYANIYKREFALEEYRKIHYPHLPSRKHSIWVADKKQIEFWRTQFENSELELFQISLTGTLFKSSDKFIPDDELDIEESMQAAEKYWNPIFTTEEEENKAEFLFQGKVKILEKIK